ncbi:hypothetical protein RCO48_35300 [Peribacillus frigoritolerans]|nr:hypothetical protein [Peribacillus frigoritolerans]
MEQADDTRPEAISVHGEAAVQSNQPSVSLGTMPESDSSEAIPEVQPKSPKKTYSIQCDDA